MPKSPSRRTSITLAIRLRRAFAHFSYFPPIESNLLRRLMRWLSASEPPWLRSRTMAPGGSAAPSIMMHHHIARRIARPPSTPPRTRLLGNRRMPDMVGGLLLPIRVALRTRHELPVVQAAEWCRNGADSSRPLVRKETLALTAATTSSLSRHPQAFQYSVPRPCTSFRHQNRSNRSSTYIHPCDLCRRSRHHQPKLYPRPRNRTTCRRPVRLLAGAESQHGPLPTPSPSRASLLQQRTAAC